jgi:hypothetical protein
MCQLHCVSRCPGSWLNIICVCVCVYVFPQEINIWIVELNKANSSLQCGWVAYNPLRVWIEQKGKRKMDLRCFYLMLVYGYLSPLPLLLLVFWLNRLGLESTSWFSSCEDFKLFHQLSWITSLQAADGGTFQLR